MCGGGASDGLRGGTRPVASYGHRAVLLVPRDGVEEKRRKVGWVTKGPHLRATKSFGCAVTHC